MQLLTYPWKSTWGSITILLMLLANMFTLLIYFPEHLNTSGDSQNLSEQEDIEYFIQSATSYFSTSEKCLQVYHKDIRSLKQLYPIARQDSQSTLQEYLRPHGHFIERLPIQWVIVLWESYFCYCTETLYKIHQGHQGISRFLIWSMSSAWWPKVSKAFESYAKNCTHCQGH